MSTFFDGYAATMSKGGASFPSESEFLQEFPTLLAALKGNPGQDGTPTMPTCTLMIFIEGGRLKFCISPKQGNRVCFGTLETPVKGLWSVEDAMREGKCEWKVMRGR